MILFYNYIKPLQIIRCKNKKLPAIMQRVAATAANIFGLAVAIPMVVIGCPAIILEINELNNFIQDGFCQFIDNR